MFLLSNSDLIQAPSRFCALGNLPPAAASSFVPRVFRATSHHHCLLLHCFCFSSLFYCGYLYIGENGDCIGSLFWKLHNLGDSFVVLCGIQQCLISLIARHLLLKHIWLSNSDALSPSEDCQRLEDWRTCTHLSAIDALLHDLSTNIYCIGHSSHKLLNKFSWHFRDICPQSLSHGVLYDH